MLLWGDAFVIPANSPNKYTAEVFLNFLTAPGDQCPDSQ